MIGENIKKLRTEKKLTQKDLADRLYVTPQAVSRWENGEVEPSLSVIKKMAEIFNVTCDNLMDSVFEPSEEEKKTEYVYSEPVRPVLGVCEKCNKPIYDGNDIYRTTGYDGSKRIICKTCKEYEDKRARESNKLTAKSNRTKSFIFGTLAFAACIIAGIILLANGYETKIAVAAFAGSVLMFALVSCILLDNNYISDAFEWIWDLGFVKLPGLIFEFDLDGFVWLICMKLLFRIIGIILSVTAFIAACVICGFLAIFTYPFALRRNIKHPEIFNE